MRPAPDTVPRGLPQAGGGGARNEASAAFPVPAGIPGVNADPAGLESGWKTAGNRLAENS